MRHVRLVVVNQMVDMKAGPSYLTRACCVGVKTRQDKSELGEENERKQWG